MTAVTADNTTAVKSKLVDSEGFKSDYEVAASTTIYKDTFVGLNATGYLTSQVARPTGTTVTGTKFVGVALGNVDNSSGSDADKRCKVLTSGYFEYTLTNDRVDIGIPVYCADNATLIFEASGYGPPIGYVVAVEATTKIIVKLIPDAGWAGNLFCVVSDALNFDTLTDTCLLVHECENPNGMYCVTAGMVCTETNLCDQTPGVVSLQHTATTSMGITFTAADDLPINDLIIAGGVGALWAPASATNEAIVVATAGVQINAKVTTASADAGAETGQGKIFAQFMSI